MSILHNWLLCELNHSHMGKSSFSIDKQYKFTFKIYM